MKPPAAASFGWRSAFVCLAADAIVLSHTVEPRPLGAAGALGLPTFRSFSQRLFLVARRWHRWSHIFSGYARRLEGASRDTGADVRNRCVRAYIRAHGDVCMHACVHGIPGSRAGDELVLVRLVPAVGKCCRTCVPIEIDIYSHGLCSYGLGLGWATTLAFV